MSEWFSQRDGCFTFSPIAQKVRVFLERRVPILPLVRMPYQLTPNRYRVDDQHGPEHPQMLNFRANLRKRAELYPDLRAAADATWAHARRKDRRSRRRCPLCSHRGALDNRGSVGSA